MVLGMGKGFGYRSGFWVWIRVLGMDNGFGYGLVFWVQIRVLGMDKCFGHGSGFGVQIRVLGMNYLCAMGFKNSPEVTLVESHSSRQSVMRWP